MPSQDTNTPPIALDDLSTVEIADVVDQARKRLGRELLHDGAHHSRVNGTAGFRTDAGTWVRLSWRCSTRFSLPAWTGTEAAAAVITGVPRPQWIAAATWADPRRSVVWKAEETTLAPSPAISTTAEITPDTQLPEPWWGELSAGLDKLAAHTTDRVALEQAHLTRRIHEVNGTGIDTQVPEDEWACAHGDLGYANLTSPELMLLDWESWGMAPAGWDAACLWSASLGVPETAATVLTRFEDALNTRAGLLCRLLLCANTARATARTGRDLPLSKVMATTAESILVELSQMP